MIRYLSLLLFIGLAWGQENQDKLVLKNGVEYQGNFEKIEEDIIYFKPNGEYSPQPVPLDKIERLLLSDGVLLINTGLLIEFDSKVDVSINDASSNAQNIKGLIIVGGLNQSNQYAEEELNDFDINYIDGYNLGIEKSFGNTRFGVGLNQRGVKLKSESNIMDISISVNGEQRVNYLTLHTVYPYMIQEKVTVFGGVQFGKGLGGEAKVKSLMSGSLLGEDYDHGFEQTEEIDADDMSLEYGLFIGVDYIINEFIGVRASYFKGLSDISEYAKIKNNTISVSLLFIPILGF